MGVPIGSTRLKFTSCHCAGKVDEAVVIEVAIDQPAQRGEWQVKTINRMREEQRIAPPALRWSTDREA
jgi:hypothetical protein